MTRPVYLIEAKPYDLVGAAEVTLRFSFNAFHPVYNGALWRDRLTQPLPFARRIFQNGFGRGTVQPGGLALANGDGQLDALLDYAWDGRPVTVWRGLHGQAWGSFTQVFKGRARAVAADEETIRLTVGDFSDLLAKPLQATLYAGTGDAEGGADLKGKPKPLAYGAPLNCEPVWLDQARLIAQVHDGRIYGVTAVYDRAVSLTPSGVDHASYAAMKAAASPPPGTYDTCLIAGCIRLGSLPLGPVTVDVKGDYDGTTWFRTGADIAKRILKTRGSLTDADLVLSSFTALNTANSATLSLYWDHPSVNIDAVLDDIMVSLGGWWIWTASGTLHLGQFVIGAPASTIDVKDLESIQIDEIQQPVWRLRTGYKPCWRVQSAGEIAAGADGRSLAVAINAVSLTDVADGKAFLHGLAADGAPADTDGAYRYSGQNITVKRNGFSDGSTLHTSQQQSGYIVHDSDPSSAVFQDEFAGANNTTLASHAPDLGTSWTKYSSSASLLLDGAGKVKANTTGTNSVGYYVTPAAAGADVMVECRVDVWSTTADKGAFLFARYNSGNGNCYWLRLQCVSTGVYSAKIYAVTSSGTVNTLLLSVGISPVPAARFRLSCIGSTIAVWQKSPSDVTWKLLGSVTNTSITAAGDAGMGQGDIAPGLTVGTDTTIRTSAFKLSEPISPFTVDSQRPAAVFARYNAGAWQYDNGAGWTTFTPMSSQLVIGTLTRGATAIDVALLTQPQLLDAGGAGETLITRSDFVAQARRFVLSEDAALKTTYLNAREIEVAGLLDAAGDAQAEGDRQFDLLSAPAKIWRATALDLGMTPAIGTTYTLTDTRKRNNGASGARLGLGGGKTVVCIGREDAPESETVTFLFWG